MSETSFFTKLDESKKTEMIQFLIENNSFLFIKIQNTHFKSKIVAARPGHLFSVYKFSLENYDKQEIICSFEYKNEKYFFKSIINSINDEFRINQPNTIYQLQRRNDFRVTIPFGTLHTCEVIQWNQKKVSIPVNLVDMSLGGCQISFKKDQIELKQKDEITFKLKIQQFENLQIEAIAKHIKQNAESDIYTAGLQFIDPDAGLLTDLQGLLVSLDRIHRSKID